MDWPVNRNANRNSSRSREPKMTNQSRWMRSNSKNRTEGDRRRSRDTERSGRIAATGSSRLDLATVDCLNGQECKQRIAIHLLICSPPILPSHCWIPFFFSPERKRKFYFSFSPNKQAVFLLCLPGFFQFLTFVAWTISHFVYLLRGVSSSLFCLDGCHVTLYNLI